MKILYYTWGENSKEDVLYTFRKLNYDVTEWDLRPTDYDADLEFLKLLKKKIKETGIEVIFSFDFIPVIARCIRELNEEAGADLIYISWIYDCPHMTLFSPYAAYDRNYIFVFDRFLCNKLWKMGYNNVYYMPLAVNVDRLNKQLGLPEKIGQENISVSFVGSLYEDNFYDKIKYFPDYIRGYVSALIESQKKMYGCNIVAELLDERIMKEVSRYLSVPLGQGYRAGLKEVLTDMINMKITSDERISMCRKVSESYGLTLCTGSDKKLVPKAEHRGYVSYEKEMPEIFRDSAINLNITLRSIESGIPLRVLDIMGAGGFLMSNYQPELAEYFEDGKDVVLFGSEKDLLEKIGYYLEHDELRREIAYNGWQKVQGRFGYEHALKQIFKTVFN